jgi:hypothetical protein
VHAPANPDMSTKPKKEIMPKDWVVESDKMAKRRLNVKAKLNVAQLDQERDDALAYAAAVQAHANAEALEAQASLLVGGQVLANALATSCGTTASKPSALKEPMVSW